MPNTRIRERSALAGLVLAMGLWVPVTAGAQDLHFLLGTVTAVPAGIPVGGARVEVLGALDPSGNPLVSETTTGLLTGEYFISPAPAGEHVLEVTGNCLETTDVPITVPASGSVETDIAVENPSVAGVGDCLPYPHVPNPSVPTFWQNLVLRHRATISNKRPFALSLPFPVKLGNASYRKVWVTANGWISFNKPVATCAQLTPAGAPAASIFALAQCGETTEVKYDVLDTKPRRVVVLRWNLVTPGTTERSDVAVRFFEDHPADIGVSYVALRGTATNGSNGFIGFSTKSGAIFTLGDHEAAVKNGRSLIFRPSL